MKTQAILSIVCAGLWMVSAPWAAAGGTPLNIVVVVNEASIDSLTIANWYCQLRDLPDSHVILLGDIPAGERSDIKLFRERILDPVLQEANARGLARQLTTIAYSAGFPTAFDLSADFDGPDVPTDKIYTKVGSLNGLTYLFPLVQSGRPTYVGLASNFYYRPPLERVLEGNPFIGGKPMEQWNIAEDLSTQGKHVESAQEFINLFQQHPRLHPLAYRAARELMQAGQQEQAGQWLWRAVESGWSNKRFLEQDPAWEPLKGSDDFTTSLLGMEEETIDGRLPIRPFVPGVYWSRVGISVPPSAVAAQTVGLPYLMSTSLAVTGGVGPDLKSAIEILRRARSADQTHPAALVAYADTDDVRSKTRADNFDGAIEALKRLGLEGVREPTALPVGSDRLLAVISGTAQFQWPADAPEFLPGGIGDNLTSLGGALGAPSGQTPLTEFLVHGAAGASGTVTEPFSVAAKFADAYLPVYYAMGASLAEAYYMSVASPYQLLIVGDPLCSPYAAAPQLSLGGIEDGQSLTGDKAPVTLELSPGRDGSAAAAIQFFMDGQLRAVTGPLKKFDVELKGLPAGWHRIDIVATANNPAGNSARATANFQVQAKGVQLELLNPEVKGVGPSATIDLLVRSAGVSNVRIQHLGRTVAELGESNDGPVTLPVSQVGYGPVRFQAVAQREGKQIVSAPLTVDVPLPDLSADGAAR